MAKKARRRPSRNERDQAGCISGLMSIFDFRQTRSTRRLLSDRSRANEEVNGVSGQTDNRSIESRHAEIFDSLDDPEDNEVPTYDMPRRSVKKLMEEEMITDSDLIFERDSSKHGNLPKKSNHRKKRAGNKSTDMDVHELSDTHSKAFDLVKSMEDFFTGNQMETRTKTGSNCDRIILSNNAATVVEDRLVSAVNLLLEKRMSKMNHFGEEEDEEEESSEFIDALETLSSNRGSFLKLLEDPNSTLVKHIEHFEDFPICKNGQESNFLEESAKPDDKRIKNLSFFRRRRRRSKSLGNCNFVDSVNGSQSPNRIVLLKPGPAGPEIETAAKNNTSSRFSDADSKVLLSTRHASNFSFTEIKRRLKHVMGKDSNATDESSPSKFSPKHQSSNFGWSSPNRNHFYTERFTVSSRSSRKDERVCNSNDISLSPRVAGGSNIYVEAKKHLSEILSNGDENVGPGSGQLPKPLGRILCFPSYNSPSPCCSPRKRFGEISVTTTPTRLSPRSPFKNDVSVVLQENPSTSCIVGEDSSDLISMKTDVEASGVDDRDCYPTEDATVREVERSSPVVGQMEEEKNVSVSSGSYDGDAAEEDDEENASIRLQEPPQCLLNSDSSEENQEKSERPSPVSILEPSFADVEISPQSVATQPDETEIEPFRIHFEEQSPPDEQMCTRISPEDEESAFEYVEAVLLGSGLNWDEFLQRWLSRWEILDPSVFDEVESFSGKPRCNQKLLFDLANGALEEICGSCFGYSTGIPSLKQTKVIIPRGMDLINEVWARVEAHVSSNSGPISYDRLVKRDLTAGPAEWVDLRSDVEVVGADVEDIIFKELVEEIVLSFEAIIRFEFSGNAIEGG